MNSLVLLLICVAILVIGYIFYGGWLCKQWGVGEGNKETPAHTMEDGVDYVPAKAPVLMGHHFSSIAGAGPITGPIGAAIFGWLPVALWILVGGIFFGGVHDFGALFASVRNKGMSIGEIISTNMSKRAKRLFIIFSYLTLILVVAAFASIVATTFGAVYDESGAVSDQKIEIEPRKGEYLLCDKSVGKMVSHTLFQLPTALGKGILVTPTVHGNLLIGPTAEDQENKEGVDTSSAGLDLVKEKAALSVKEVPLRQVITSFAGLRARLVKGTALKNKEGLYYKEGDFMIGEVPDAPGFIDVAGMESPGLSCAPATGEYVADLVAGILKPQKKDNFIAGRKGIPSMALATDEERHALIRQNPAYANIICRCEMVSEGEILDAIHRPLGATTTDGVKRRTRAGMGRCQSGFCNPRVVEILARELSVDESRIQKAQEGSYYVLPEEDGEDL